MRLWGWTARIVTGAMLVTSTLAAQATIELVRTPATAHAATTSCAASTSTEDLNAFFATQLGTIAGFDSPQVIPLPDGRSVWLIQDAYISYGGVARTLDDADTALAHNAMLIQSGRCFTVLHGPVSPGGHCSSPDASLVGHWLTEPCRTWFWPMGGAVDAEGMLTVFYVEMSNPLGVGAAPPAAPLYTWRAQFDLDTFELERFDYAVDAGFDVMFGHAVESDGTYSYLFGQSRDQFNRPDPSSPPESLVFVGRVPQGRFDRPLEYWNGTAWTTDRASSAPVLYGSGTQSFQAHPRLIDGVWVAATKVDDWFTSAVRLDVATAPQGSWRTAATVSAPTRTMDGRTNTYGTQVMPWRAPNGNLVVAVSNNAWDFAGIGLTQPRLYRPTFFELQAPAELPAGPEIATIGGPLSYVPRPPIRAADTRLDRRMGAGETRRIDLAPYVAPGARAVVVNLTLAGPDGASHLTAWPCDRPMPRASSVNAPSGGTKAAHAVIALDAQAGLCVFTIAASDVIVDVSGSYVPAGSPGALGFRPSAPSRLYDSRRAGGRLGTGEVRRIPAPAGAAVVNVVGIHPDGPAHLTLFPCGETVPTVSNLNLLPGQVVANMADVITPGGALCVFAFRAMDVVIDLLGTYDGGPGSLAFYPIQPTRIVDSRIGQGTVVGKVGTDIPGFGVFPGQAPVSLAGVPDSARSILVSEVVVDPTGPGHLTIGACRAAPEADFPTTSNINFDPGDVVANQAVVATPQGSRSSVCSWALRPAWHVIDLVGWYR